MGRVNIYSGAIPDLSPGWRAQAKCEQSHSVSVDGTKNGGICDVTLSTISDTTYCWYLEAYMSNM